MSRDRSVPEDNVAPEEASYMRTMKPPRSSGPMVQIVRPSEDHTREIFLALRLIILATPPVWTSQIMMALLEAQAMEHPSGE